MWKSVFVFIFLYLLIGSLRKDGQCSSKKGDFWVRTLENWGRRSFGHVGGQCPGLDCPKYPGHEWSVLHWPYTVHHSFIHSFTHFFIPFVIHLSYNYTWLLLFIRLWVMKRKLRWTIHGNHINHMKFYTEKSNVNKDISNTSRSLAYSVATARFSAILKSIRHNIITALYFCLSWLKCYILGKPYVLLYYHYFTLNIYPLT